jgi:L-ascorbate metabolism protein UlaG (beta-lactamase superfamily)
LALLSLRLTYLGHATTLLELDGVRLVTDPVLSVRVGHLRRVAPVLDVGAVDGILVSHGHLDHHHRASLRSFPGATPVLVPRVLGGVIRSYGFTDVRELSDGESSALGSLEIRATRADHGGRSMPGRPAVAAGFVIGGTESVYFAGDTDLFDEMTGLVPNLDLALIPIWGWGPTLGPGHLDPERAAEAVRRLNPRVAVPIHWGTLRPFYRSKNAEFLTAPLMAFAAAAQELAPQADIRVLRPGEAATL